MRLAFLGSPPAAVPTLRALVEAGHEVALVVSGPDKRRGRGGARTPTAVKAAALELGLPVSEQLDDVAGAGVELGVVVAYGRIIPGALLEVVPMVNLHFSLLPRWRGAAPVERAILAGDERTGVCVMDVAEGLDTGNVHAVAEVPIDDRVTAAALTATLADVGAELLVGALAAGLGPGAAQADDGVTYARKITAEDRHIDWSRTAPEVSRVVRIGGAWTTFRGARLKVLDAEVLDAGVLDAGVTDAPVVAGDPAPGRLEGTTVACGAGSLTLRTVQPQGRAPLDAEAWRNGARPRPGERLGADGPTVPTGG
jgi:methionyl-tRNA formyltransferase